MRSSIISSASEARTGREGRRIALVVKHNRRLAVGTQHELKDGAFRFVRGTHSWPSWASMIERQIDKPIPHTARFCSEQWVEYPPELL